MNRLISIAWIALALSFVATVNAEQPFPATVRYVAPSGDKTGKADFEAITQAIKDLSFSGAPIETRVGTVILTGDYFTNEVLTFGSEGGKFIAMDGGGHSRLYYVGPKTDKFLVTFIGTARAQMTLLHNMRIDGGWRCRGVRFQNIAYQTLMDNSFIYAMRQCAVHAPDCWGSRIRNTMVDTFSGLGFLATQFNATSVESLRFTYAFSCWYGDESPTSAKSKELQALEVANGQAAAKEKYGNKYSSDWPDDLVSRFNRATVVVVGNTQTWRNIIFENCHPAEYPLMVWNTSASLMDGVYCEGNSTRNASVVVGANQVVGQPGADFVTLTRCRDYGATVQRRSFVELIGRTAGVQVTDSLLGSFESVIYAQSGTHFGPRVERVSSTLPKRQWIKAGPSAAIISELPADTTAR